MRPIPIMLIGDSPNLPTGLARIGRDLAYRLCSMPEFRVAYAGRASYGSVHNPWQDYLTHPNSQWGQDMLRSYWEDFTTPSERASKSGIILTVWDSHRLAWLVYPDGLRDEAWLRSRPFKLWGYFMQDASGVRPDALPYHAALAMSQFDRINLASKWAHNLARNSLADTLDIDWIPHPVDCKMFSPNAESRASIRSAWGIGDDWILIGCVMTNQVRKHWPTVLETIALMPGTKLWMHTDKMSPDLEGGYWDLPALVQEYGLTGRVLTDGHPLTDAEMAMRYNACDVTLLISGGEGFGYPIAESLACGTPVVTGDYSAGRELMRAPGVSPDHTQIDTRFSVRRAYYEPKSIVPFVESLVHMGVRERAVVSAKVDHLDHDKLRPVWEKWFRKGIQ